MTRPTGQLWGRGRPLHPHSASPHPHSSSPSSFDRGAGEDPSTLLTTLSAKDTRGGRQALSTSRPLLGLSHGHSHHRREQQQSGTSPLQSRDQESTTRQCSQGTQYVLCYQERASAQALVYVGVRLQQGWSSLGLGRKPGTNACHTLAEVFHLLTNRRHRSQNWVCVTSRLLSSTGTSHIRLVSTHAPRVCTVTDSSSTSFSRAKSSIPGGPALRLAINRRKTFSNWLPNLKALMLKARLMSRRPANGTVIMVIRAVLSGHSPAPKSSGAHALATVRYTDALPQSGKPSGGGGIRSGASIRYVCIPMMLCPCRKSKRTLVKNNQSWRIVETS
jgi:hypothetical protein